MSSGIFIIIIIAAVVIMLNVIAYILMKAYANNNKIEDNADREEFT